MAILQPVVYTQDKQRYSGKERVGGDSRKARTIWHAAGTHDRAGGMPSDSRQLAHGRTVHGRYAD